jgi:tRNA-binding EMAP/Myf-like protein
VPSAAALRQDYPARNRSTSPNLQTVFTHARIRGLCGLKRERADRQELVGKQALFVVNLAPKKMMGELSEGMLFNIG